MGKAIGVDLGTTNTAVAVLVDGRPRVLEDEKGYKVLPSCVAFKGDGTRVVGQSARNLIITQPENTAYAVKRLMGRRFDSPEVAEVQKLVSYRIAQADDGMCKILVGEDWYSPIQISAVILQVAKQMAERTLGEPVEEAVITVPAYFNHAQRSATFEAARLAGLRCERLLNEPTAAALAYGYRKDVERRIVVYDLGGGTFDVSVLQLARGIYEVLSTSGETHLGGEDFDQRIVDQLSEDFQAKTGVDPRTDPTALQRLKDAAERAKCELSFTDRTTILIPMITMADSLETGLSRLVLEGLVEDLIERTLEITRDAIKAAGLRLADIDDVILVGGQTRMPRVREAIRSLFQKEPSRSVHPEEVVAIGAAVHATSLTSTDAHKPLLLDVTPFDLGIDVAGGLFKRIIEANSQVPASFTETFATVRDNQRLVRVAVRQGGDPLAENNEFLGEFVMTGLSAAPRMETKVDVTFKIDTNGMLHVSATEQGSGERKRITIRNYAEFVKGDGSVAPDLEGDLGGPDEEELAAEAAAAGGSAAGAAPQPGFLRRLFGGRKKASPAITPDPGSAPPAEGASPEQDLGLPPEMPAFLQELGDADLTSLEATEGLEAPSGLDAVGEGLDALGLGDLTPLSAADLAPVVPASDLTPIAAPELPAAASADDSTDAFVMPAPDDDEEFYEDEDFEVYDDEEDLGAFGGAEDEDLEAYEGEAVLLDGAEHDTDDAGFGPPEAAPLEAEPSHSDPFAPPPLAGFGDPTESPLVGASSQPGAGFLSPLDDDEAFEVDDSTRTLVEPIAEASPEPPLPASEFVEEQLWTDDDLPDDGTVEYTRDGATSTPRSADWKLADVGLEVTYADQTLVDAVPVDFDEAPTDPPIEVAAPSSGNVRLRMAYPSSQRLADDLVTGLRRGGCFVSTDEPMAVGATCLLEYTAPDLPDPIQLEAIVTWSTRDPSTSAVGHTPGMDVEFRTKRDHRKWLVRTLESFRA